VVISSCCRNQDCHREQAVPLSQKDPTIFVACFTKTEDYEMAKML
jgi:hypothetical protein